MMEEEPRKNRYVLGIFLPSKNNVVNTAVSVAHVWARALMQNKSFFAVFSNQQTNQHIYISSHVHDFKTEEVGVKLFF